MTAQNTSNLSHRTDTQYRDGREEANEAINVSNEEEEEETAINVSNAAYCPHGREFLKIQQEKKNTDKNI